MAILRATQFAAGLINGSAVTNVYTVPAGHRIILKTVELLEASGVACTVQLRLSGLGTLVAVNLAAYPAGGASVELARWIVFNPGDVLQLARSNAFQYSYVLSGSLLFI